VTGGTLSRAEELRREFDDGFSRAAVSASGATEALFGLGLGGDAYALRMGEISGLYADRRIVPVPGPLPELLGIAGLRGAIVPVFSLESLLGYPPESSRPRWLVHAGQGPGIGLAFCDFAGHFRVPKGSVLLVREGGRPHVIEAVARDGRPHGVIAVASILESLRARCQPLAKEP
jgi:purine-binding chemotaxis protein CheW